jgi:hypothetical protein
LSDDDLTILVDSPPQVPLLTSDPDEDFVHEDGVAVTAVPAPQSMLVLGPELVAPEADRLVGDGDASPGQQIFDVPVAEIEAVIEPDGVLDDLRRKSVPPVRALSAFHPGIVASRRLIWQYPIVCSSDEIRMI